ncbi:hypothetical protein N7495_005466 [Penicillium taxi]|uniref:uncharacterized protein n=1 Tax=Penicillium taxi TaxID=168475 RepID=UPI00254590DD|nr:uncharacterized protein N7495_005466 [Penicillium taxi]KAJ5893775.1 hypothetical protein N7495_005466 [Penicillium taxi]
MATSLQSAMRRSLASISKSNLKAAVSQPATTSVFQRTRLPVSRGLNSFSQSRNSLTRTGHRTCTVPQNTPGLRSHVRYTSDDSGPVFRQWGFEEVNAIIPPAHGSVILVDVREPAELNGTGIIPSAINIPLASQSDALYLKSDEFETRFGFPKPVVDADHQIVFYCKAGVRAQAAAQLAAQAGYDPERIGVYFGSWLDWERNGGRVERWDGDD